MISVLTPCYVAFPPPAAEDDTAAGLVRTSAFLAPRQLAETTAECCVVPRQGLSFSACCEVLNQAFLGDFAVPVQGVAGE